MILPVSLQLDAIAEAFRNAPALILSAAPGSGKTTLVPPRLLEEVSGSILLLEPRRVAARAAACRIAFLQGEAPGKRFGYAVRDESCRSAETRLLAVTPGILLNLLHEDPVLERVDAVIFDEFHERSAECDLLFALISDLQKVLRPELKLLLMSATANLPALKALLPEAAVVEVPGRQFPVTLEYADETPPPQELLTCGVRAVIREFNRETAGDILFFLPGVREIESACAALTAALPSHAQILPLHGGLTLDQQNACLRPAPPGVRKVIVSTNVAESSITIDGVSCVVDSGVEKSLRYDPAAGMSFLELRRIALDSADQRSGRAGRTAPGRAFRCWRKGEDFNRSAHGVPEILECDLARIALELAAWGTPENQLHWSDPPPQATLAEARELLRELGALDEDFALTKRGKVLLGLPVHPRIGAMLLYAQEHRCLPVAIDLAALLEDRLPLRQDTADCRLLLEEFRRRGNGTFRQAVRRLRNLFRVAGDAASADDAPYGTLLGHAFPDWIAQARAPHGLDYRLAGGGAARLRDGDDLQRAEFLAVGRMDGHAGREGIIRFAAPIDRQELEEHFRDVIREELELDFTDSGRIQCRQVRKLGALRLQERLVPPPAGAATRLVLEYALRHDLPLPPPDAAAANRFLERLRFAARKDADFPAWDEAHWGTILTEELLPLMPEVRSLEDLQKQNWKDLLVSALGYGTIAKLDREWPEFFVTPAGARHPIDYAGESPSVAARVQEFYGLKKHPTVGRNPVPLKLTLLSPAQRPVQVTSDLPGFWSGSWELVRKEMRARYPKHDWPEFPAEALPLTGRRRKE